MGKICDISHLIHGFHKSLSQLLKVLIGKWMEFFVLHVPKMGNLESK